MRKFPENIRSLAGELSTAITNVYSVVKAMCSQSDLLTHFFTSKDAWKVGGGHNDNVVIAEAGHQIALRIKRSVN